VAWLLWASGWCIAAFPRHRERLAWGPGDGNEYPRSSAWMRRNLARMRSGLRYGSRFVVRQYGSNRADFLIAEHAGCIADSFGTFAIAAQTSD